MNPNKLPKIEAKITTYSFTKKWPNIIFSVPSFHSYKKILVTMQYISSAHHHCFFKLVFNNLCIGIRIFPDIYMVYCC